MIKKVPNILCILRIILSVSFLFLREKTVAFVVVYIIAGLTDMIDGTIARKFHAESALGAKLDALADVVFLGSGLLTAVLIVKIDLSKTLLIASGIWIVCAGALKAVDLLVTKVKFGQVNTIHTYLNKIMGFSLFVAIPVCVALRRIPFWVVAIVMALASVGVIEELLILLTSKEYDVDRISLLVPSKKK